MSSIACLWSNDQFVCPAHMSCAWRYSFRLMDKQLAATRQAAITLAQVMLNADMIVFAHRLLVFGVSGGAAAMQTLPFNDVAAVAFQDSEMCLCVGSRGRDMQCSSVPLGFGSPFPSPWRPVGLLHRVADTNSVTASSRTAPNPQTHPGVTLSLQTSW